MNDAITVNLSVYKQLMKDSTKLTMLEAAGVDNWEGYGDALNPEGDPSYSVLCDQIDQRFAAA